jgi:hypothetical protein
MNTPYPVDDVVLNAYVDGELSPGEAARIALRLAQDPALARKVAELHRLKAGVSGLLDELAPASPPLPALPQKRGWSRMATLLATATVAAGIAGALLLFVPRMPAPPDRLVSALAAQNPQEGLIAAHDGWAAMASADTSGSVVAPDWLGELLEANGLRLVLATTVDAGTGGPAEHLGFIGENNCRLSLFLSFADRGTPGDLSITSESDRFTASWETTDLSVLLVARNMDPLRFTTIATSIHAATRTLNHDRRDLLAAMAGARQTCSV